MPAMRILTRRKRSQQRLGMIMTVGLLLISQMGCVQSLVMMGRVLLGDPVQPSGFEVATGISLPEEQKRVLIHCSAPAYLADEFDTLTSDIEEELIRRLKRRGVAVMHADATADVLDDFGGQFDPNLLAMRLEDVDYIFHITFDNFTYREDNSPNLYRGRASGNVVAHEIRGGDDGAGRHAVEVYDQQFNVTHPSTHPVAADQMPQTVFIRKFTNNLADQLGHTFYGLRNSDLFVQ